MMRWHKKRSNKVKIEKNTEQYDDAINDWSALQDGLTIYAGQFYRCIDGHTVDAMQQYWVWREFKLPEQSGSFNANYINEVDFSDYKEVETHVFTTYQSYMEFMNEWLLKYDCTKSV